MYLEQLQGPSRILQDACQKVGRRGPRQQRRLDRKFQNGETHLLDHQVKAILD